MIGPVGIQGISSWLISDVLPTCGILASQYLVVTVSRRKQWQGSYRFKSRLSALALLSPNWAGAEVEKRKCNKMRLRTMKQTICRRSRSRNCLVHVCSSSRRDLGREWEWSSRSVKSVNWTCSQVHWCLVHVSHALECQATTVSLDWCPSSKSDKEPCPRCSTLSSKPRNTLFLIGYPRLHRSPFQNRYVLPPTSTSTYLSLQCAEPEPGPVLFLLSTCCSERLNLQRPTPTGQNPFLINIQSVSDDESQVRHRHSRKAHNIEIR